MKQETPSVEGVVSNERLRADAAEGCNAKTNNEQTFTSASSHRYGASPEEWGFWDLIMGFKLWPVVSNPDAQISANTKMKQLGKIPSRYNHAREVIGITKWTSRDATRAELQQFSQEPDYGICVRTGLGGDAGIVFLDIDIDDTNFADRIERVFLGAVGKELPVRMRSGSGRRIIAFRFNERIDKDRLGKPGGRVGDRSDACLGGGLVELLGFGQQGVVAGTHPSGARYCWRSACKPYDTSSGNPPLHIPTLDRSQLNAGWRAIAVLLGEEPRDVGGHRPRQIGGHIDCDDPVAEWLLNAGLVLSSHEDKLYITCPWKDGHSGDSGETETAWLIAGSNGHGAGNFKCMHASCADRYRTDFLKKIGYTATLFPNLTDGADERNSSPVHPRGLYADKSGRIPATLSNLVIALTDSHWIGMQIGYDRFKAEELCREPGANEWKSITDNDRTTLRLTLEQNGFKQIKRDDLRDAMRLIAEQNSFDSAMDWLQSLEWDGVPRVARFLADHFGAADTPYSGAVSRYWWTAHAGRILCPGCQADMVPILVSPEGRYKSTTLQALVPKLEQFTEIDLSHKDADLSRRMRGVLLGELAELRGLRGRTAEANKAWVTQRIEKWRRMYSEDMIRFPRRLVLVGTTNDDDFLDNSTGERRWLPIRITGADPLRLAKERDQLWAEACNMVLARIEENARGEVDWEDAFTLGKAEGEQFKFEDAWAQTFLRWYNENLQVLDSVIPRSEGFSTEEALIGIGKLTANINRADTTRMASLLRHLGFQQIRKRRFGAQLRLWVRSVPDGDTSVPDEAAQQ